MNLGPTEVNKVKLGSTDVNKIMLGATEVWSSVQLPTGTDMYEFERVVVPSLDVLTGCSSKDDMCFVYTASNNGELFAFDLTNPEVPESFDSLISIGDVITWVSPDINGNFLSIINENPTLIPITVTSTDIIEESIIPVGGKGHAIITVPGGYIVFLSDSVVTLDTSKVVITDTSHSTDASYCPAISGNNILWICKPPYTEDEYIMYVDYTDMNNPITGEAFIVGGPVFDLFSKGDNILYVGREDGFEVIDVSDKDAPVSITFFDTGGSEPHGINVVGDVLFARTGEYFMFFDVSDFGNIQLISTMPTYLTTPDTGDTKSYQPQIYGVVAYVLSGDSLVAINIA